MSEQVKVQLLTDGWYGNNGSEDAIVGGIVYAIPYGSGKGYDILVSELKEVGYTGDGTVSDYDTLFFYASEVEVLDD